MTRARIAGPGGGDGAEMYQDLLLDDRGLRDERHVSCRATPSILSGVRPRRSPRGTTHEEEVLAVVICGVILTARTCAAPFVAKPLEKAS